MTKMKAEDKREFLLLGLIAYAVTGSLMFWMCRQKGASPEVTWVVTALAPFIIAAGCALSYLAFLVAMFAYVWISRHIAEPTMRALRKVWPGL